MPSVTISVTAVAEKVMVVNDPAPPVGAAIAKTQLGFVRGTTTEMVSAPVSLTAVNGIAELLSTGLIAAAVCPPRRRAIAGCPTHRGIGGQWHPKSSLFDVPGNQLHGHANILLRADRSLIRDRGLMCRGQYGVPGRNDD